jgi:branched-chain amino acid transport system permease protein
MVTIISFGINLGTLLAIWMIIVLALNLHWGYSGLLNFGHFGFVLVGAYTSALVTLSPSQVTFQPIFMGNAPFVVGLIAAAIITALLGLVIGLASLRLGDIYLALVTVALHVALLTFLNAEEGIAGGTEGIQATRPFAGLVGESVAVAGLSFPIWDSIYFGIVLMLLVGVYVFLERLGTSPFGRVLKGIREDDEVIKIFGKKPSKFKIYSFVIGAAIAGVGGALWGHYVTAITPYTFPPTSTFFAWIAMLVGGAGNNRGALVGTAVFFGILNATAFLPSIPGRPGAISAIRLIALGVILIAIMRWAPEGLLSETEGETILQ